jgi:hypothetical protein
MYQQDKTFTVFIKAIGNGKKIYRHDGQNVSVLVSKEDYTFLKETRGTMEAEKILKKSNILNNGLKRLGLDNEVYNAEAIIVPENRS